LPSSNDIITEYLDTDDRKYTGTLLRYIFDSHRLDSDYHYWG
jgi:hypothetical protein